MSIKRSVSEFFQALGIVLAVAIPLLLWLLSALAIPALCITVIWYLLNH